MKNVWIEQRPMSMSFDVFFIERAGNRSLIYRWRDGEWSLEDYDEGTADLEPSLTFRRDMLEEFVREAAGHVHAEESTVRHLDDATATRDRLLALIEKRGLR